MRTRICLRLVLACWVAWSARPDATARAWQFLEDGGYDIDVARSMTLDPDGDLIVGGRLGTKYIVFKLNSVSGAEVWRRSFKNVIGQVARVATDSAGNVLAAGHTLDKSTSHPGDTQLTVVKLDPDGVPLWQTNVDAGNPDPTFSGVTTPFDLIADRDGNAVVAVNFRLMPAQLATATVIKLARGDGAELWRYERENSAAHDLAQLGSDVAAVGRSGWVVRLAGSSGMPVWEQVVPLQDFWSVAVDPSGDVVAGGSDLSSGGAVAVRKFAGATGAPLWTYSPPSPLHGVYRVAVDAAGDVAVAGRIGDATSMPSHPFVARLSGATGTELFRNDLTDLERTEMFAFENGHPVPLHLGFGVDAGGNSYLATPSGTADNVDITVLKLDSSGATDWLQTFTGAPANSYDLPYDLIATSGAIYISGQLGGGHDRDFLVTEIDDSTGSCRGDGCMEALDLSKWKTVHKFEKKWLWGIVAGGHPLVPPPADTVDDPTTAGATIELANPGTGERATFVLPPGANWTQLTRRGDPTVVGYRYDDPTGAAGPCTQFSMVSGGKLKLKCTVKGSVAPFSLDEASQGVLDVHLQIGRYPYCLSTAGGRVVRDEGGSLGGPPGSFKVVKAPPPVACER